jgi:hypothetical protein
MVDKVDKKSTQRNLKIAIFKYFKEENIAAYKRLATMSPKDRLKEFPINKSLRI